MYHSIYSIKERIRLTEFFIEQLSHFDDGMKYLMTFLISMLPIVELRGAGPVGTALGLDPYLVLLFSIIGNIVPVPFIVIFARKIIQILKRTKFFSKIADRLESKVEKNKAKIIKYEKLGLFIFVALPLPGTGAWTGALVSSFLDLRLKNSFIPISAGVVTAGIIMTLGSQAVKFLFSLF